MRWYDGANSSTGGIIADRTKRIDGVLFTGLVLFGAMLVIASRTDAVLVSFVGLGLVAGLSAGPIMSLPSRVLAPGNRSVGMGIFYTLFYALVVLAPFAAGSLADVSGRINIAFDLGTAMLAGSALLLIAFRHLDQLRAQA